MKLTVVIPTWNRLPLLREVLAALDVAQCPDGGFEVIVVSDGATDGTAEWLRTWSPRHSFRFALQSNAGPAKARNQGAALAAGERILFLGDDTVPAPDLLVQHVSRAQSEPDPSKIAVLGYTNWHPRMRQTPFLRHINERGLQFGFGVITDPEDVPFNFFYTSNVSLDRGLFARLGGFDTEFTTAAWEDVEFALRARDSGMRIVYMPAARCAHDHPTTVDSFLRRQERAGEAGAIFARKHPHMASWLGVSSVGRIKPMAWRWFCHKALRAGEAVPLMFSPRLCDHVMRQAYLIGLARALGAAGSSALSRGGGRCDVGPEKCGSQK